MTARKQTAVELRRKSKYPDTDYFKWYNANTKGKIVDDCIIRAMAVALDVDWETAYKELMEFGLKHCDLPDNESCFKKYLKEKGFVQMKQPRDEYNRRLRIWECKDMLESHGRVFANAGRNHVVAIVDGVVYDTWDSSGQILGKWWVKN